MIWTIEQRIKFAEALGWTNCEYIGTVGVQVFTNAHGDLPDWNLKRRPLPKYNTLDEIAEVEEKFRETFQQAPIEPPADYNENKWVVSWTQYETSGNIDIVTLCYHKSEKIARGTALLELIEATA